MRTNHIVLAVVGVLLLALVGYGFITNPSGCAKLGEDLVAIYFPPPPAPAPVTPVAKSPAVVPAAPVKKAPVTPPPAKAVVAAPVVPPPAKPAVTAVAAATNVATSVAPPAPAPTPESAPVEATPGVPYKAWAPPEVMPAQANWTWTTPEKVYQNVVVTKIEPETVTITHSMGVAHIPIASLPPDMQKALNYDPAAAASAKAETEREDLHPYYSLASLAEAQGVARQLHWPLAWICSDLVALKSANPTPNSEDELTQMAVNDLKTRTIVIFLNSNEDLGKAPAVLRDQGFFIMDDGAVPGGHHFYAPKIVFSDVDATKALARVSHTQLLSSRTSAIEKALQAVADASAPKPATDAGVTAPAAATTAP